MKRRDFLARLAGGTLAGGRAGSGSEAVSVAQKHTNRVAAPTKRDRISVSSWSLHNYFQSTREKEFNLPGPPLVLLDFPELIADKYKVHRLEFVAPHFASTEPGYLKEIKSHLVRTHSQVVNIPVDIDEIDMQGGLSDPDEKVRTQVVNASKKWIDIAAAIGSKSVRCDPGQMKADNLAPTVESYKQLAGYGRTKGVRVIIENHGGVGSEHPEKLLAVFKQVGGDFIGALPDFGNFPDETTREKGLKLLFPHAPVVCHAKGLEFDANGNETKFDFPKCVEIAKGAGFKGTYSIEYEGPGDPYAGVQQVLDNLLKYL